MIDQYLRLEFFMSWILLSALAHVAQRLDKYDDAFKLEQGAMGALMLFQDIKFLPQDLRRRLLQRVKLQWVICIGITVMLWTAGR